MTTPAMPKGVLLGGAGLLLGGLVLATAGGRRRRRPPKPKHRPDAAWVIAQYKRLRYPLPAPGRAHLVAIARRTTDGSRQPKDPWDDWIGILGRTPDGHLHYTQAVGTAEPGWAPMWHKGRIASPPEGVSRLYAPQYSPDAYGGGFHHWRKDRPAFRQVSTVVIEIFNADTGKWRGPIRSTTSHHNGHTTSTADWRKTAERGVGDWSHGCPVVLRKEDHKVLLKRGGWTADIDGVRLALVVLPWTGR